MERIDANRVLISTPQIPITLFANESVYVDRASVAEVEEFAKIIDVIADLRRVGFLAMDARIDLSDRRPHHAGDDLRSAACIKSVIFVIKLMC